MARRPMYFEGELNGKPIKFKREHGGVAFADGVYAALCDGASVNAYNMPGWDETEYHVKLELRSGPNGYYIGSAGEIDEAGRFLSERDEAAFLDRAAERDRKFLQFDPKGVADGIVAAAGEPRRSVRSHGDRTHAVVCRRELSLSHFADCVRRCDAKGPVVGPKAHVAFAECCNHVAETCFPAGRRPSGFDEAKLDAIRQDAAAAFEVIRGDGRSFHAFCSGLDGHAVRELFPDAVQEITAVRSRPVPEKRVLPGAEAKPGKPSLEDRRGGFRTLGEKQRFEADPDRWWYDVLKDDPGRFVDACRRYYTDRANEAVSKSHGVSFELSSVTGPSVSMSEMADILSSKSRCRSGYTKNDAVAMADACNAVARMAFLDGPGEGIPDSEAGRRFRVAFRDAVVADCGSVADVLHGAKKNFEPFALRVDPWTEQALFGEGGPVSEVREAVREKAAPEARPHRTSIPDYMVPEQSGADLMCELV